jgi:hypothetical protein
MQGKKALEATPESRREEALVLCASRQLQYDFPFALALLTGAIEQPANVLCQCAWDAWEMLPLTAYLPACFLE